MKKISSTISSQRISDKNSESKYKIAMKKFLKKEHINLLVLPRTYKINTHKWCCQFDLSEYTVLATVDVFWSTQQMKGKGLKNIILDNKKKYF